MRSTRSRSALTAACACACAAVALAGCGSATSNTTASSSAGIGAQPSASSSVNASGLKCSTAPGTNANPPQYSLPSKSVAEGKTFVATVVTNCGDLTFELYGDKAPQTVASFLQLAAKYWVNSPCQRLTTAESGIYVLQCGDPTGTGSGSPGYGFGIENAPSNGDYPAGTLAMARASSPDSNGGQFFIVYADTQLPTEGGGYSIFGKVIGGMNIIDAIAKAGSDNTNGAGDGHPNQPISILKITVTEKKA
ncbi:peptidylprolyl isomerase [Rudaeicoccus suwonensis]|uniref:Peptidyl-prolyl cis-trans isomerase n=1 Tax=Rudaeicoccus suwonensis TaxID=657409 RepID=A0A561EB96_9MICO|nr:peptidylprolyl isomerase [Rudaeicoccus suwonensis]TWE12872.1 peptidyl-prolyl cis-trans isomerase B (cyclophilin B) [Rudaeicoccus suwonensis]